MRSLDEACWLCERPLGHNVEMHHPVPRSRGGRETVPLHPVCHRAIHNAFGNKELERVGGSIEALRANPMVAKYLAWIANKPPDFHVPTARRR